MISSRLARIVLRLFAVSLLTSTSVASLATEIHGVITDASGANVPGATVALLSSGSVVTSTTSGSDGGFQLLTGQSGRFYLVVSAKTFRQLETPGFYANQFDNIERNVVLEPAWVRESIVVTATGTPTPQPQVGAAISVLGASDIALRTDFVNPLQLMPGTFVAQTGQRGSQASLFIRGGDSDANMILIDGVSAGDLGGRFDFGPLSTAGMERAEVYRGPDSNLYGADAASGVVSFTTPHGTTSFPSVLFHGDSGNFTTLQSDLTVAGAHKKIDYLGEYNWFQTANDLPNDQFHVGTAVGNLGLQLNAKTQIRGTIHYGVSATGVPGPVRFYDLANNATQKDQDIYLSASIDNQTTAPFHNLVRYGLTRKREQYHLWTQNGSGTFDDFGDSYGYLVTITGANGYSTSGQALMNFAGTYPQESQLVSNRDELVYQGDYTVTPHLVAQIGFQFEDERGAEPGSSFYPPVERTNYDYRAAVHGDFKTRFFYTLGGALEHYSLFGTQTTPNAGFSFYAMRPRDGIFSGTRIMFNFGDAVREPSLTDQFFSLYNFLQTNGGQSTIDALHISPLAAPTTRTYDGGVEQSFLNQRLVFRTRFFHNEFGKQIEYVGIDLIPQLLPDLTPEEQKQLEEFLQANGAFELSINSEAFRALGVEATIESGLGRNIFLRGGYTYLDAVVQQSFSNDTTLLGPIPTFDGIPVGAVSPLQGARPFRRPPHTGFFTATYAGKTFSAQFTSAFVSRSDDSTFLGGMDIDGGNSLLLPNRNLDHGYARLDLGGSYQVLPWLGIYAFAENLTDNQRMAPIGFVSLPFNIRTGLKIEWGKQRGK
jgi:iron complex outermembrane receptor protein/vitamin B12 transporter